MFDFYNMVQYKEHGAVQGSGTHFHYLSKCKTRVSIITSKLSSREGIFNSLSQFIIQFIPHVAPF